MENKLTRNLDFDLSLFVKILILSIVLLLLDFGNRLFNNTVSINTNNEQILAKSLFISAILASYILPALIVLKSRVKINSDFGFQELILLFFGVIAGFILLEMGVFVALLLSIYSYSLSIKKIILNFKMKNKSRVLVNSLVILFSIIIIFVTNWGFVYFE